MNYYRICGIDVAAELDLPGAATLATLDSPPDAIIERRPVSERLAGATRCGPTWQVAERQVLLSVPGVARFLMTGGRELAYDPAPGRTEAELAIFVMGSALGALLHQRGCFVLHASAAEVDGQAAIFCGQSGAGKSSLVAALCGAGRGLVADDVCVVQFDREGRPLAVPDGRRLKLWSDAVKRLSLEGRRGAPVRDGIEKYWVDPPMHVPTTSLPIEDIFFLRDARQATGTAIEPLPLLEAVELLRAHAYRPRLVAALGQEGEWLRQCVAMMRRTRAFLLTRALNFQELESSLAAIEDHWSRGGH